MIVTKHKVDRAALVPGGIDLNTADMGMTVVRDANGGVKVNVDPAMLARVRIHGLGRVEPFIIQMQAMTSGEINPLLGLK